MQRNTGEIATSGKNGTMEVLTVKSWFLFFEEHINTKKKKDLKKEYKFALEWIYLSAPFCFLFFLKRTIATI